MSRKIAFVLETFAVGGPAQQLLDRFLLGYPREGEFHRMEDCTLCAHLANASGNGAELERRSTEHGLLVAPTLTQALAGAGAVVVVPRGSGAQPNDALLESVLNGAQRGARVFVYGALGSTTEAATRHVDRAKTHSIQVLAGTSLAVTWRLPDTTVPAGAPIREALIVVQGAAPEAELDGLQGILPLIEHRKGGESGVRSVRLLTGAKLWEAGAAKEWSCELLAAALSRSDSPQGDAVLDGRTQDLVGLGLVPKLARDPRAWLIEHRDGLRSTLMVLDGVVADCNFALGLRNGAVLSAQLYRPPKPAQHEFSRLAAVLEDFFQTGHAPWPVTRAILTSSLLASFRQS
jgi:hypothetical protein